MPFSYTIPLALDTWDVLHGKGTIITTLSNEKEILYSLQNTLGTNEPIRAFPRPDDKTPVYVDWINPDGSIIPLKGYGFYTQNFSDGDALNKLGNKTKEFFISRGFKEVAMNRLVEKKYYNIEDQFEKTNFKCMLRLQGNEVVICGIYDKVQDDLRKEFMKTLNPEHNPLAKFDVGNIIGNYATGVSQEGYGYVWVANKINGEWKIIYKNNGGVTCSFLRENSIPKELVDCL